MTPDAAEHDEDRIEKQRASDMAATARTDAFFNRCRGVEFEILHIFTSVIYRFWRHECN
jgi:hypothetical protein